MPGKAAQPEWLGPAACITSAMAVRSRVAAASTREGLRAEVAAAVAGKEAELSPSARLEVTCLHPQDFAHGNPVLAYPIFSSLHLAKWAVSAFVFLSWERKTVVGYRAEKPQAETHGWGQGAKEQYWCAAFSSQDRAYVLETGSPLDFHSIRTCPGDVPSPRRVRTLLCGIPYIWHGAAIGPGMET